MSQRSRVIVEKEKRTISSYLPVLTIIAALGLYVSISFFFSVQAQENALSEREEALNSAVIDLETNTVYAEDGTNLRMDLEGQNYVDYVFTETMSQFLIPGVAVFILGAGVLIYLHLRKIH